MSVKIIHGTNASNYQNDAKFLQRWKELAENAPQITVFQALECICLWQKHYADRLESVLIIGLNEKNHLVGFIPLALERENSQLVQADAQLTEYSGWLYRSEITEEFFILDKPL